MVEGTGQFALMSNETQSGFLNRFGPELVLVVVVLVWSSTFIITKEAIKIFTPNSYLFARFGTILVLAFAVLTVQSFRSGFGPMWRIAPRDFVRFAVSGVLAYTCYQLGFTFGLVHTSTFASSLMISTMPLFTLIFAAVLGERHPRGAWIGVLIAMTGVAVFLLDTGTGDSSLRGNLYSVGAAIAMSIYWIVNRPLVQRYPATTVSAYTILTGTIPLLILGWNDARAQDWGALEARHWLMILYMAIFPIYLVYIGNNWVISKRGVTATSAQLAVPVVSGILSVAILHESLGGLKMLGAAIVLGGLLLIQRTRIRATNEPPPE